MFTVLQVLYRLGSALGGGFAVMLLTRYLQTGALLFVPYIIVFFGGSILLLWLAKQLPTRLRTSSPKSLVHRFLTALYG
jgi:hypothetical protein